MRRALNWQHPFSRRGVVAGAVASMVALTIFAGSAAAGRQANTVGGYVYAGSKAQTAAAAKAGAKAAGAKKTLPAGKTIAVIELSGTSSESIGVVASVKQIASLLHYKVITCDPNFDAQKVIQCATSMVAQHPSIVFSVSTNTGAMGSGYKQAIAAGIPWIDVVSAAVPAKGLLNYGTTGFELTKILDSYLFKQMKAKNSGSPKLFAIGAPTVGIASANEGKQLAKDAKAAGITLINHDLDLSNAVQDAIKTSAQALQQNPDLGGMWTLCDFCLPLMAQQVRTAQGASRHTLVAGMYANPAAVSGIKKGTIDGVADYPWQASVWVGIDQVLQHWARHAPIASGSAVYGKYPFNFFKPYMITKSNVGSGAAIPVFGPDFQTYFTTKWKKEFGLK